MPGIGRFRIRLVVALALGAGLGACAALQPHADNTRYYVLTVEQQGAERPAAATRALPGTGTAITIGHVVIPAYLDRNELVSRAGSNQLTVHDEARWGEPLNDGLQRALRGDLASQLGEDHVRRAASDGAHPTDLVVDVEVRRFEPVKVPASAPTVELEATWTVREAGSGRVVAARTSNLREPITGGSDDGAAVAAMSRVVAQFGHEIAGAVDKLPVRGTGSPTSNH